MVAAGIVAGLVALRLRRTFARVVAESEARERVINLFGQHVSPAVVDRLLARPVRAAGRVSGTSMVRRPRGHGSAPPSTTATVVVSLGRALARPCARREDRLIAWRKKDEFLRA
jgi:hypothetical protein